MEDLVRSLGYMTLGSRLKRLGERMQADVAEASAHFGLPIGAGLYAAMAAIDLHGSLAVGELAEALGISQPAATKLTARLLDAGMITATPLRDDRRSRTLALSEAGLRTVVAGRERLWPLVERAVRDLCEATSGSFAEQLDALERDLESRSLSARILALAPDAPEPEHDAS